MSAVTGSKDANPVRAGAAEIEGLTSGRTPAIPRPGESALILLVGIIFGLTLMKSEVVSWFRIYEMFRFDSFQLYGVIGSAVVVGALGIAALRRSGIRTREGGAISVPAKARTPWFARYALGGTVFGFGWGLLGACPGPIFGWIGAGESIYLVPLASAMLGTWAYGAVRDRLPH